MRVLLGFDKFKGALTAGDACRIAAEVLAVERPDVQVDAAPLTDGGEGFCETLVGGAGGTIESVRVSDPLGREIDAPLGWVDADRLPTSVVSQGKPSSSGKWAVVEMASASGLLLLSPDERDPWKTGSQGTGRLIRHAVERGAAGIVLGVGGSATNDGGCGALEALGVGFLDENGAELRRVRPELFDLIRTVSFPADLRLPRLVIATDVNSPLLGPAGATAVFGPQKGLRDIVPMEEALEKIGGKLMEASEVAMNPEGPGNGAAGGLGFGLSALAPIEWRSGFDLVSDWLGLEKRLEAADRMLTGEGSLDAGSLSGKGPVALLRLAHRFGVSSRVIAGRVDRGAAAALQSELPGVEWVALSDPLWSLDNALARTGARLAEEVGNWCREML